MDELRESWQRARHGLATVTLADAIVLAWVKSGERNERPSHYAVTYSSGLAEREAAGLVSDKAL
jgi:hypothetical protein